MGELAYINVKPEDVQPGDLATHVDGNLDTRKVAKVSREEKGYPVIWLAFWAGYEGGPYLLENYTFQRRVTD